MVDKFGLNKEDFPTYKDYRKEYVRLYNNTDSSKLSKKKYQLTDVGKLSQQKYQQKYRKTNAFKESLKKYREANKEKLFERNKKYIEANKEWKRSHNAKRRASKLRRTPVWADIEAIKQFYLNCPKGMTVDHDYPLQGQNVSGLHVLENLRYLTLSENSSKGNKFPY